MYITPRSLPKPSNDEGSKSLLHPRKIPAAVLAFGVVSLLTDVSSESVSAILPLYITAVLGLPSQVRMSADSSLVATRTFVRGHSYAQAALSTETIIRRNGKTLGNIESWRTTVDARPMRSVDRNFWGVTFAADSDTFYATAARGNTTWLMCGSLKGRSMISLRTDAECPSLSPDQTKIAYKKSLDSTTRGGWWLVVLDLRASQESLLAETRSVDDQVEWLDDNRLLYWLYRSVSQATTSDVWVVPVDGTGSPAVLIPEAFSSAVVR
jgi:hypothetical protein